MRKVVVGVVAVVVVAVGGGIAYFALHNKDAPSKPSLSANATVPAAAGAMLAGNWTVHNPESFTGYRMREKLAALPVSSDAVGRTTVVTGTMQVAGTSVQTVVVQADLRELTSNDNRRDRRIHSIGLESDAFPFAKFTLTQPIALAEQPQQNQELSFTASGTLELHGVTQPVTVPLQAKWAGNTIDVVGTVPIDCSDYKIEPPDIAGFVKVEDKGAFDDEPPVHEGLTQVACSSTACGGQSGRSAPGTASTRRSRARSRGRSAIDSGSPPCSPHTPSLMLGPDRAAPLDAHLHELADAPMVDRLERVARAAGPPRGSAP